MRILVVGAGGVGGYFGGRLLQAGRDVTFLVRPPRAAALAEHGLVIRSPRGDVHFAAPPLVTADALSGAFDLVLLSCKAYDLDDAIESFAPVVGPETAILPLLNGMRHLDVLDARFGAAHVLGGRCLISATIDPDGAIRQFGEIHAITFGERDGSRSERAEAIARELNGAVFDGRLSETIVQDMWDKWVFIAAAAGLTCLMRAPVGDIVAAGGTGLATALLDECAAIATARGFAPSEAFLQQSRAMLTALGSVLTASMLRDLERGGRTEVEHLLGDMLRRKTVAGTFSLLQTAYVHVSAYEIRRAREAAP